MESVSISVHPLLNSLSGFPPRREMRGVNARIQSFGFRFIPSALMRHASAVGFSFHAL